MATSSQLRILRNPGFTLLWTAGLITVTGNWLLAVALPIYIYQLTDSPAATAFAVGVRVAVGMVAAPIAGAYVDRWDRRRVLVGANVAMAVTLLPLIAVNSEHDLWIAYAVIALQALMATFALPAEHALLPRLVPEADLAVANGMNALNNNMARLIGPALGGVVAVTMGIDGAVLLDSASFVIAATLAFLIRGAHRAQPSPKRHLLHEIADGVRTIGQSVVLRALFAVIAVTSIGEGIMGSLFAVFVVDALNGGVKQVGWLMSAQAVGGIAGGLACGIVARRLSATRIVAIGLAVFGIIDVIIFNYPRWLTAFEPVVLLFIVVGIPAAIMSAAAFTLFQTEAADGMRARVLSAILVVEAAGGLIGATLAGLLTDRLGVVNVLTGQGLAYILSALAFVLVIGRRRRPVDVVTQASLSDSRPGLSPVAERV